MFLSSRAKREDRSCGWQRSGRWRVMCSVVGQGRSNYPVMQFVFSSSLTINTCAAGMWRRPLTSTPCALLEAYTNTGNATWGFHPSSYRSRHFKGALRNIKLVRFCFAMFRTRDVPVPSARVDFSLVVYWWARPLGHLTLLSSSCHDPLLWENAV